MERNGRNTTRRSITRTINRSKTRTKRRMKTREKVRMRLRLEVGLKRESKSKSMTTAATETEIAATMNAAAEATTTTPTTTTTTTTALNINLSRWFALKVAKRGGSSMMKPLLMLPLLLLLSSLAGQQVVSAHKSIPIANTVWDFGMPHAPPTSSKAGLSSAPAFAIEPPSLVEYSNSTGTVIACRPQVSSTTTTTTTTATTTTSMNNMMTILMTNPTTITSNQEPIGGAGGGVGSKSGGSSSKQDSISDQQSRLASNTPTAISWRLVKRLPSQLNTGIRGGGGDDSLTTTTTTIQQPEDLALPLNSSSRLYFVRQDGALVFNPFKAVDFRHDLHLATYKCCLSNRYGSICSRPVRTRAVLDTNFNVEVFDEFALAQNSITLNCQVQPTYVAKFVQVIAWLRNDKILITYEQSRQQISASTNSYLNNKKQQQQQQINNNNFVAQNQNKYFILETGQLFIRNVSKQYDSGTYKCRVRYKLTNILVTSKIGAQLMVDDSKTKTSELKLVNEPNRQQLIWRQENSDAFICANIQSNPVASFTWFRQNFNSNERQLISELNWPDIRQLDSCIYIQQLQQKHSADYICEANNGESSSKSTTSRLIVTSSHLSAQIQLIQAHQLVRGNSDLISPPSPQTIRTQTSINQLQYQSTVQFGSNIYLNCSISGFPFDTIAWYKDTKLIAVSSYYPFQMQTPTTIPTTSAKITNRLFSNIKLVQETVILIENFGLKDRGVYQCQVYSAQANNLPLNLSQIATKSQLLNQKLITNGFEQHQVGSNEFQLEQDYLRSASGSIQLEIAYSKPIISQKFPSQSVQHGGQLSLQCVVFGLPAPHILWFLDGLLISSSLSFSSAQTSMKNTYSTYFNNVEDNDSLLVVEGREVGEEEEGKKGGTKEEKGQNLDGEAEFKFRDIKALEISNLLWNNDIQATTTTLNTQQYSGDVDEISSLPPSLNVIEDERFQVKTHFISPESGTKAPNFLNYHQKVIEEKYHQQQQQQQQQPQQPMLLSELNISQLSVSETGQYKCLAINPLGSNQHVGQVNVISTTNSQELELRSYQATNVTLIAGKSSTLQCPLIGYPLSRVDWFHDGQRLPINRRQRIEPIKFGFGGQLELTNVDKLSDGGIYTCRVSLAQKSALPQLAPPSNGLNGSNVDITEQQEREQHHHQQQELNTNQQDKQQQLNRGSNEGGGGGGASNFVQQQDDLVGQIQANVKVAPLIDSESLPEIKQANEGMTIQLVCSVVQGDRPVRINWLKRVGDKNKIAFVGGAQLTGFELMKNSILQSEEENQLEEGETTKVKVSKNKQSFEKDNLEDSFNGLWLTFKQISYTDSGDYVCLVQNDVGQSMRLTRVIVNVAPSWSNELSSDVSVLLGDRLQLDCLAHGFPQPHVTWRREIKSKQQIVYNSPPNELAIWQQQQQQQQSQDSQFKDIKDSQSNEFTNIISNYHTRAYLNGSLIIDQVDQSDGGIFMCEVNNGIGTGLSRVVRVKVNVPPYFKHRSTTYLGQLGTKAELKCIAFGDHPMLIGWRKDSDIVDLVNDNRHRLVREHKLAQQNAFESILTIDNLTRLDSGQYMCIASNEYGSEEMRIQLIVQEPPEEPVLMRPIRATSRQATLTLRPPYSGNSQIKKYAIIFKQIDFSNDNNNNSSNFVKFDHQMINWQQILIDAPQQQQQQQSSQEQQQLLAATPVSTFLSPPIKLISNESSMILSPSLNSFNNVNNNNQHLVSLNLCCLQPFTRYVVRVKAINEIGSSEPSKPIQFMTDEEVIGGPPLDVSVEATGAHSLKVRWRSPAKNLQNGLIRGYYIGYRATNLPGSPSSNLAASNNLMLSENNNLKANHQSLSISSPNIKVFELMESEQYQYKNVQLDMNALNLRQYNLNMPEFLQQDSASLLLSNNNNSLPSSLITQVSQSQPQVFTSYLTNLRRKTAYSIIVQAYNKIGAGPRSDSITVSTLDAAPPMSPILKLLSTSFNSAQLIWSSRKFDNNDNNNNSSHENNNFSSKIQQQQQQAGSTTRVFNFEESLEEDEDDDPQSYYTINFKTLDEKSAQIANDGGGQHEQNDDNWQQRRVQKRQQLPYVLTSLKCGSHYAAFMTATNSLGQSEPGETIKFTTLGAAPIAASNSKDFLHVNSTYIILRLNAWQNAACIINSFTFKFKSVNQVKWNILEHQVHPTIQTVTVAGSAVFSVQNNPETSYLVNELAHQQQQQQQQQQNYPENWMTSSGFDNKQRQIFQGTSMLSNNKQQTFSDFVLRNLLPNTMYKLIVEANSEAGMTTAEYEFETGNFTTSTISINVNGINADNSIFSMQNKNGRVGFESSDLGELDFSYSGGQRALNPFQRYNLGVWSLTALFVIASIFMAITTLILGFRSIIKMKSISNSRESLLSAIFCCSNSSSSSSSGADSSHSSSAGTCYQVSDHPIDPYYTLSNHCLMLSNDLTPTRARLNGGGASTISGHLDSCDGGELKSIMGDPLPFRQMVSSSSLSTIGARYNQQQQQRQQQQLDNQQVRRTHTLGSAAHCQAVARRFSNDEPSQSVNQIKAHYAATLGKQQSTFMQHNNQQPIKYNSNNNTINQSPLYGRLQAKPGLLSTNPDFENQQQLLYSTNNNSNADNYQHFQHPLSSSGTSGYDTNNSIKVGSDVDRQSQPIYMQGGNPVVAAAAAAAAATAYQMNMYGTNINNDIVDVNSNLFEQDANLNGLNREQQNQGQFHYNVPGDVGRNISCQQQQQQLADAAVYGIIYGNNQQVILGQNESEMKQLDQQQQQFEQQSQELNHHLALLANNQQQQQQNNQQ